jgi:hypothetical protein
MIFTWSRAAVENRLCNLVWFFPILSGASFRSGSCFCFSFCHFSSCMEVCLIYRFFCQINSGRRPFFFDVEYFWVLYVTCVYFVLNLSLCISLSRTLVKLKNWTRFIISVGLKTKIFWSLWNEASWNNTYLVGLWIDLNSMEKISAITKLSWNELRFPFYEYNWVGRHFYLNSPALNRTESMCIKYVFWWELLLLWFQMLTKLEPSVECAFRGDSLSEHGTKTGIWLLSNQYLPEKRYCDCLTCAAILANVKSGFLAVISNQQCTTLHLYSHIG